MHVRQICEKPDVLPRFPPWTLVAQGHSLKNGIVEHLAFKFKRAKHINYNKSAKTLNLRKKIQAQRRALPPRIIESRSVAIANIFGSHPLFQKAKRLASFISVNGEQNASELNLLAWERHKTLALPKLRPYNHRLWFVKYTPNSTMKLNQFLIPEPGKPDQLIAPWSLDLVLVPLVAFDRTGNRLGMGGGYYDMSFESNLRQHKRPKMIGIAHGFQEVVALKPQPWDVPLDAIVTEKELILC